MAHEALPTVKCSSCGQPVALDDLGDHVCLPLPLPPPSLLALQKPPISPKSAATTLLPQRLQSLVARSPHRSSFEKPSAEVLAPSRDPFQRESNTATPKTTNVPFPKNSPPPSSLSLDRDRHQLPAAPPPPERVSTPLRDPIPPALQRIRIPSNAGRIVPISPARAAFPVPFGEPPTHPVPRRSTPLSSARRDNPTQQPPAPPRSPFTDRAPSSVMPPSSIYPRPSFERTRTPSTVSTSRPSLDKSPPSLDKLRPSLDTRRPSPDSQHPLSVPPSAPFSRPPKVAVPAPSPGTIPFPSSAPVFAPPVSARQPPPPPLSLAYSHAHPMDREIDTKIGGEAGMAGVGRRGFAAAARAAMFVASRSPSRQPAHLTTLGDSHRANVPQYLDTAFDHVMRGKSSI